MWRKVRVTGEGGMNELCWQTIRININTTFTKLQVELRHQPASQPGDDRPGRSLMLRNGIMV